MKLREALLKEHSKKQAMLIANYIKHDHALFAQLMTLFFANEIKITQRAAWVVSCCAEKYPQLILPHLKAMVDNLNTIPLHDAVKRNTFRILQTVAIPKNLMGKVANSCFDALTNKKEAVAIKVFAMTVLLQIVKTNPELKNEFQMIIEEQLPYLSAAFKSRGKKVLNELTKIKP